MASKPPATVYDLLQLQAGTRENPVWINDEFEAVVSNVKVGQKATTCTLADPHNPGVTIAATFFGRSGADRFNGCVCHFAGQGMTRTEYNGAQQVTIGQKATVNVVGRQPGPQGGQNAGTGQPAQRQGNPAGAGPAPSAGSSAIHGATVGMAINQACGLIKDTQQPLELSYLNSPAFSRDLHTIASDIIRVSRVLEAGKLATSAKDRADPEFAKKQADAAAKAEADRKAAEEAEKKRLEEEAKRTNQPAPGSSSSQGNLDEDVPF